MVEAFVMNLTCASSRGELSEPLPAAGGYSAKLAPATPRRGGSAGRRVRSSPGAHFLAFSTLHTLAARPPRMVYLRGGQVQTSRSFVDELLNLPYALYAFVCFFFQTLIDVRRRPPHTPPHHHR